MSKLYVASAKHGLGVYSHRAINPGEKIAGIEGNLIHWETLNEIGGIIQQNTFRFDENYYLSPDGIGNYFNHSCSPNSKIIKKKDKLILQAVKMIQPKDEIVFDYSTILARDDVWTMKCSCGSKHCRIVVKKYTLLPKDILKKYMKEGLIPEYIQELGQ